MNFKFTFFFGAISLLSSCGNQQQESKTNKPSAETSLVNCYRYINNKDTIILKTIYINGFVTGTLVYNFYEKDKNKGTIQGKMTGDILFADYSFSSEGIQSVRPIAFRKIGENFIEGYGETENTNGKTFFKDRDSLNFAHSIVLKPYDCKK